MVSNVRSMIGTTPNKHRANVPAFRLCTAMYNVVIMSMLAGLYHQHLFNFDIYTVPNTHDLRSLSEIEKVHFLRWSIQLDRAHFCFLARQRDCLRPTISPASPHLYHSFPDVTQLAVKSWGRRYCHRWHHRVIAVYLMECASFCLTEERGLHFV